MILQDYFYYHLKGSNMGVIYSTLHTDPYPQWLPSQLSAPTALTECGSSVTTGKVSIRDVNIVTYNSPTKNKCYKYFATSTNPTDQSESDWEIKQKYYENY